MQEETVEIKEEEYERNLVCPECKEKLNLLIQKENFTFLADRKQIFHFPCDCDFEIPFSTIFLTEEAMKYEKLKAEMIEDEEEAKKLLKKEQDPWMKQILSDGLKDIQRWKNLKKLLRSKKPLGGPPIPV